MARRLQHVIVASDSFKGTLSATEICTLAAEVMAAEAPACRLTALPLADGGEGSVEAFLYALGGERRTCRVTGPDGDKVDAVWAMLPDGTAVLEMAAAAGLPLARMPRDPARATTYGVGELLVQAAQQGAKKILLGLGGSATHDGGTGAACAAGVRFYDAAGTAFCPTGATIRNVVRVDTASLHPALKRLPIHILCDVKSPLCGPQGAAYVFAAQKGAAPAALPALDAALAHLRDLLPGQYRDFAGAGAAGGMGAGMVAFFGAQFHPGVDAVLDVLSFDSYLPTADLVITGEGRLDSQSFAGKVVEGVCRRASAYGVPTVALVGGHCGDFAAAYAKGLTAVFSTQPLPQDMTAATAHAAQDYACALRNILRLWQA